MIMGTTERRIAALKIAAAMLKRLSREDPIVTAEELIKYAGKLQDFAYRGDGKEPPFA